MPWSTSLLSGGQKNQATLHQPGGWEGSKSHTEPLTGIQRARLFTKRFTNITLHLPTAPCEVGQ